MENHRIALLYLSVGSGHQVAAESLADALKQEQPNTPIYVEDPFVVKSKTLPRILNALQTVSVVLAPDIYDLVWRRKTDYDTLKWINDVGLLQDFLLEQLNRHDADIVVATHVLPCILAVGLKGRSLVKNVYGVITDFGAHSLWPLRGVNSYFVASEEIRNALVFRGINCPVHITGIPIKKGNRDGAIKSLRSKTRVLIVSGGLRSGSYSIYQRYFFDLLDILNSRFPDCLDITIVTGNQKQFKKELTDKLTGRKINVHILGFVHDMPRLLMTTDIIITKPGGLIISEALAIGICLILLEPGPGQERANADFLARQGAAFNGDTPENVAQILALLIQDPNIITKMKKKSKELGFPDSSDEIAKIILDDLNS